MLMVVCRPLLWILPTFTPSTFTTSSFSLGQSQSAPRTVRGSRLTKNKSYTPQPNFLLLSNTPLFTNCTSNLSRSRKAPRTVRGTFSPFYFPSQFFYVFSWIHPLRDHHLMWSVSFGIRPRSSTIRPFFSFCSSWIGLSLSCPPRFLCLPISVHPFYMYMRVPFLVLLHSQVCHRVYLYRRIRSHTSPLRPSSWVEL